MVVVKSLKIFSNTKLIRLSIMDRKMLKERKLITEERYSLFMLQQRYHYYYGYHHRHRHRHRHRVRQSAVPIGYWREIDFYCMYLGTPTLKKSFRSQWRHLHVCPRAFFRVLCNLLTFEYRGSLLWTVADELFICIPRFIVSELKMPCSCSPKAKAIQTQAL